MTTFAVTNSEQLLPAVNYLLSNLDTQTVSGNITIPGNVLVANTTTGVVSQAGNSTPFAYLYQYINLRYSNNAVGTAGFDTNSNNYSYFGVFNSSSPTPSSNPASYQWYEVDPPFNTATSRTLYYSAIGGRQIQWAVASSPPSSNYVVTVANVAIDLDVVTTAAGLPGERGPVVMAAVITTADPNLATSATLTGWFEASRGATSAPIGTGLTPVVGDTASFTWAAGAGQPQAAYEYNGSIWVPVSGQVISGNVIVRGTIAGNAMIANTITATQIATGTITATQIAANTITSGQIAANTITGNNIAAGTITTDNIAANTITGNNIAAGTITTNNFTGNTINGNIITGGSITTDKLAANVLTANTVISTGATIGNFASPGFWLQGNTGNARFGNTVSIGDNLTVGNNAVIGGNVTVGGIIQQGNLANNVVNTVNLVDLSVTNSTAGKANPSPTQIVYSNDSSLYPNYTRGQTIPNGVAIIPTTTSATQGSKILVNYQTYVSANANSEYNLVELWKDSLTYSSQYNLKLIFTAQNMGNSLNFIGSVKPGYMQPMYCVGSNGATLYSNDLGNTWTNASNGNITTNYSATFGYANVNYNNGTVWPGTYYFNKFDSNGVYYAGNVTLADASTSTNLGGVVSSSGDFQANVSVTINDVVLMTTGFNPNVSPGDDTIPVANRPVVYVGNNGVIYNTSGYLTANTWNSKIVAESSGVSSDLYAIGVDNYNEQGRFNNTVNSVIVGAQGTILTNTRTYNPTTGATVSSNGWSQRISNTAQNLNGVSYDPVDAIWMAVGDSGTIRKSINNGSTWTSVSSPTSANLNDIWRNDSSTFGLTYWVAVGNGGVILVSSNSGNSWTSVTNPASNGSLVFLRNLNSITYNIDASGNPYTLFVAGDGIIMRSQPPYTTWTVVYDAGYVQNSNLQRVDYYGSYANVFTTTQPSTIQRLGNNQVVTGTFIDTNFVANNLIKYYLIAGSMLANSAVFVQGSSITATEFKR